MLKPNKQTGSEQTNLTKQTNEELLEKESDFVESSNPVECGNQCTQPSEDVVEMTTIQMEQMDKPMRKKKQVWGLIPAQRKSKRFNDDGRSMLEKAQDYKRKHNLDSMQGNNSKPFSKTNSSTLANIASEIGIISRDGNPLSQSMLDNMVKLDKLRSENYG